jgi:GT2 family glycosyltransferase
MKLYVILATRGRADYVAGLCRRLLQQSLLPVRIVVAGTQESDVHAVRPLLDTSAVPIDVLLCSAHGLCAQRNTAREHLLSLRRAEGDSERYAMVYLDDDFWPDAAWLRRCADALQARPDAVGLTGRMLADGAHLSEGLTVADAEDFLAGRRPPMAHWNGGTTVRFVHCAYGCNMVFVDSVCERYTFDENLPLYGWQEDLDMSTQARRHGLIVFEPGCVGVHLGVKSGRTSGLRFGYSQIANPLYLIAKGTMGRKRALRFVLRHMLSNTWRSLRSHPHVDYRGRMAGNLLAMRDLLRGRCHPRQIERLG